VAHHSILTQLAGARQRLGYCPQHEALPAAMTAREVLTMYGRLRGVVGRDVLAAQVDGLLQQLGLRAYADVACGAYSGGNKVRVGGVRLRGPLQESADSKPHASPHWAVC
jgi:ABC-type multidrug transport system ATPase subunit